MPRASRRWVGSLALAAAVACGRSSRAPSLGSKPAPAIDAGAADSARDGHGPVDGDAPSSGLAAGWSDVTVEVPDLVLDLRYATAHNLTGAPLYPEARCLLRTAVAKRLARVARALAERGHRLVLWDCYRPASAQRLLWQRVHDPRFVAEPRFATDGTPLTGSRHSRGAAVDVSLAAADGSPRPMPTDHDDFGPGASGARATGAAAANLAELRAAMTVAGFTPLASEWWHFDAADATAYPLADLPLR